LTERELVLGENTIKTHVAHLLAKLDLRDRVQVVVVAYEAGLVALELAACRPTPRPDGLPTRAAGTHRPARQRHRETPP
jgi:FMN phosphatase YigB (HAD superfamily)